MLCKHGINVMVIAVVALAALPLTAVGQQSRAVSPGAPDSLPLTRDECPSFSWVDVPETRFYELAVYQLADGHELDGAAAFDLDNATEVLYVQVPGGATSWSPTLEECLAPGGDFAWFVRAIFDPDTGEASEWSHPLLFSIAAAPSAYEVEQALGVLRQYLENGGNADIDPRSVSRLMEPATGSSGGVPTLADKLAPVSVLNGSAAIRGEQPDATGEAYGVIGTSASVVGAGLGAANTGGGPDLVLDGTADGAVDAVLRESGIDRQSPTSQTFAIDNTGGGGMTLEVDGVEVVTTATDRDTMDGLGCDDDEVAKWNGTSWVCAADDDSPPRDPGNQLSVSGNTFDVVEGPGSGLDADALDGHDSTWFANLNHLHDGRYYTETELNTSSAGGVVHWDNLTGVPVGFADGVDDDTTYIPGVGVIIDNGRIVIDPDAFVVRVSVVDRADDVGQFSSVAIGADGLGLISYYDVTNGNLKVAHCDDLLCTSATVTALDTSDDVGQYTSVAIGRDGLGLISYYDALSADLKVAHCRDVECTYADISTLDSTGDAGQYTSVAIGNDGFGLIAYRGGADLKVAHCTDTACTGADIATLGGSARYISVGIGKDDLGLVSFQEGDSLRAAHCDNGACSSATFSTLDSEPLRIVGDYASLAIGADGFGLISYSGGHSELKVAHCTDVLCSSGGVEVTTLDTSVNIDSWTSVATDADGRALISYSSTTQLKVVRCVDTSCTSVILTDVMRSSDTTEPASVAIGADGLGLISAYEYDYLGGVLTVVHLPVGM